jgi:hypothetical protein
LIDVNIWRELIIEVFLGLVEGIIGLVIAEAEGRGASVASAGQTNETANTYPPSSPP